MTQDFLSCLYQVDKSDICRAWRRIELMAKYVLGVRKTIRVSATEAERLIIDATVQPIQRPSRKQRCWYSGKKKHHVIKNKIIITEAGRSVSTSASVPGRVHDRDLRKRGPPLPQGSHANADSGYQGLQDDHPDAEIPYKSSKQRSLTRDEKAYNHGLRRFHVRVQHKLAQIKCFRLLSDRFHYPRDTYITKFAITAGIVNILSGF